MKVYTVFSGDDFEGGGHGDLFRLETDALMELHAIVKQRNEVGEEYKPDGEKQYRSGYDYLRIVEYDVI